MYPDAARAHQFGHARSPWKRPFAVAAVLALTGIAAGCWLRRRLVVVTVSGLSMAPTYADGDRVLVRRTPAGQTRAGQVAVVELPDLDRGWVGPPANGKVTGYRWMIKRVVAVPDDPVPHDRMPDVIDRRESHVPANRLLVLGDNSHGSYDSRSFGYVPADRVLGVVLRRFGRPPDRGRT